MKRQASKALKHIREKLLAAEKQREELQKKVLPQVKAAHLPVRSYGGATCLG